jgi:FkbM family methyltransferase
MGYAPGEVRLKTRLARSLLPGPALRRWQASRTARSIERYPARSETHSYHGHEFRVQIADPMGEMWYGHDWPDTVLPEFEALRAVVQPGDTVFEIGAHQGIIALMLADLVGPSGCVVAVEPNHHNASVMTTNVLENRLGQVVPLLAAVGETPGQLWFSRYGATVRPDRKGAELVPCVTIDQLSATYGRPDLLWIDVEGFECQVLNGARATMEARPNVALEIHTGPLLDAQGGSTVEALDWFRDGYELLWNPEPNGRRFGLDRFDIDAPPVDRFGLLALRASVPAAV